jgi:hypothetical protein
MSEPIDASVPFRWDLVAPDQLGSLLAGTVDPDLWFLNDLTRCAGKALARSGNGDLLFVGRSLDSMFDLLSGVLTDIATDVRLARLLFSFQREAIRAGRGCGLLRCHLSSAWPPAGSSPMSASPRPPSRGAPVR